ncbi:MAG: helix-turn-helix transcriptional regulator [Flavobacteriales bacterium]|nr:helix-turn-helix transcriptional regulator [Flavobacteriales bacterium]
MGRATSSQTKLTPSDTPECPAERALRSISGKWKPQVLRAAAEAPVRFNQLLRTIRESNKQAITNALRDLERDQLLTRTVVQQKPLHVEYALTDQGRTIIGLLRAMEPL